MSIPTNSSPYGSPSSYQLSPRSFDMSSQISQSNFSPMGQQKRGFGSRLWEGLFGKPERNYQQSTLNPMQQPLLENLLNASRGQGAGGAFGTAADYYRSLFDENNPTMQALAAPEYRNFQENIIPELAEQFAGLGYGSLGSGFRNAATQSGMGLAERLAAIRANLRNQAAQGLTGIGQIGISPSYQENIHRPETFGLVGGLTEGVGKGLGSTLGNLGTFGLFGRNKSSTGETG